MDSILNYERKDEDDFYKIMGCDELSSVEQISTEYKARAILCHPDKHPNDPDAAKKFAILQRAKETLCEPDERKRYDRWQRSGIAVPYDDWCARHDATKTSLHWASKAKKEPMIEAAHDDDPYINTPCGVTPPDVWKRGDSNALLEQFRKYEI